MSNYQDRFLLTLEPETEAIKFVKKILESPLGLGQTLIKCLFERKYDSLANDLDEIKGYAAGITSSKKFSADYPLAALYVDLFAYHQFVHSSFRARQGKVLERIVQSILEEFYHCETTDGNTTKQRKFIESLIGMKSDLDMDAVGFNHEKDKVVFIQIRSRDDTGGTTAKASLVDYAKAMLRANVTDKKDILYVIAVWDGRHCQQKQSLITKCYSSLKENISVSESEFVDNITTGLIIDGKMKMILTYGTDELLKAVSDWLEIPFNEVSSTVRDIIHTIENWDDLWLAYSIGNLELENLKIYGRTNIQILNKLLFENNIHIGKPKTPNFKESIVNATNELIPLWKDDIISFKTVAHKAQYIHDLLYLKACYEYIK